jgi:DNA helicase HerA-like ATPase
MLILHDAPTGDLSHIQAIAEIAEGFALFDYVRIQQVDGAGWIGQIVQPNQNISLVGNRLDPTILHGLRLMQSHRNVQSVESVQVFDILILGQYADGQMLTPRLRPLPGAAVVRLNAEEAAAVIELPRRAEHEDGSSNVFGELLNADGVPLCLDDRKFNYHIMVTGGTGSGKSNVAANLIHQAVKYGKCVLVHDAKPDYGLIDRANTDPRVAAIWERFEDYRLHPHEAADVRRIGFYGKCNPVAVDEVVGFRASDFSPEMVAGLFFTGSGPVEQNGYEGFAGAADALRRQMELGEIVHYTLDQILAEVSRRNEANGNVQPNEAIHDLTVRSILRKVGNRRRAYPWLDTVGREIRLDAGGRPIQSRRAPSRFQQSRLDGPPTREVVTFNLGHLIGAGRILVIDYSEMEDHSYAVLLSYFLRQCQRFRQAQRNHSRLDPETEPQPGIVQLVDEAHRIFDNESRYGSALASAFERVMREGRSVDHSIILSLQNASQIPHRVMNNLNTKIVMRQNSKAEAEAATETMGKEFALQGMRLGTGHALVSMYESRATVLAQMAPSPYELMRTDNASSAAASPGASAARRQATGNSATQPAAAPAELDTGDEIPF